MALDEKLRARIDDLVHRKDVVLFMKGTRQGPQCGFSAAVVEILDSLLPEYETVNVLADQAMREGIKEYSSWPTIPQLYIKGEFVGGCDIVRDMYATGDLHARLGLSVPDRKPPTIHITDEAARVLREHAARASGMSLRLSIDSRFQPSLGFTPAQPGDIETEANGVRVVLDLMSAQRAEGLTIDCTPTARGPAFRIDNPNAPAS